MEKTVLHTTKYFVRYYQYIVSFMLKYYGNRFCYLKPYKLFKCFNVLPGNVPISIEIMPLILYGKMHEKRLVVGVIFSEVAGK